MVDIDKLHRLFLNEEGYPGRGEGHTTLFAWQLIGIAELGCFAWYKNCEIVRIPFNKTVCNVLNIIKTIEKTCEENNIPYAINKRNRIVIIGTCFEFYRVDDIPFDRPVPPPIGSNLYFTSRGDNDATWREWEMTDENIQRNNNEAGQSVSYM